MKKPAPHFSAFSPTFSFPDIPKPDLSSFDSAPRILLATVADWSGIARLPALLGQRGIAVDVIGPRCSRLLHSSWVRAFPLVGDPSRWLQQVVDFVTQHHPRYQWMSAVDDELVLHLHGHQSLPAVQRLLPVVGQGLEYLVSKFAFPVLSARNRLAVPRTFIHSDRGELLAFAEKIGFPLIVKRETGTAGRSVFRADSLQQLQHVLTGLTQHRALALQAFIPGKVFGATAVWRKGELLAWLGFEKVRCWPDAFGPASVIRLCAPTDMEMMLRQMGMLSGFNGLGGADFIRNKQGRLFALEQHPRPNSQFVFAEQAGVDLIGALQSVIEGRDDFTFQAPANVDGRYLPLFPQEVERQVAHQQWKSLQRWIHVKQYRDRMPWLDPGLLAVELARLPQNEVQKNAQ